jgi:peptide-methionine (S)-S-oxide reductase
MSEDRNKHRTVPSIPGREVAVLAGGCFWGMQDLVRKLPGVLKTRVGYTGGDVPNATYRNHGSHAEAIEIEFDPTRISYRDLLEFFFQIHDPTTLNRQGNDVGTSYRSEIFYVSEAQRDEALRTIDDVNASGLWPGRVVTKVSPAGDFWTAEPEHFSNGCIDSHWHRLHTYTQTDCAAAAALAQRWCLPCQSVVRHQ